MLSCPIYRGAGWGWGPGCCWSWTTGCRRTPPSTSVQLARRSSLLPPTALRGKGQGGSFPIIRSNLSVFISKKGKNWPFGGNWKRKSGKWVQQLGRKGLKGLSHQFEFGQKWYSFWVSLIKPPCFEEAENASHMWRQAGRKTEGIFLLPIGWRPGGKCACRVSTSIWEFLKIYPLHFKGRWKGLG